MKNKFNLTDIFIFIALASTTFYLLFRNVGKELGSFNYLWAPLALVFILFTRSAILKRFELKLLLIYGIVIVGILPFILWRSIGSFNQERIFNEFYYLLFSMSVIHYYYQANELMKFARISRIIFFFIIITLIGTNIALYFDTNIVRNAASTGDFDEFESFLYRVTGSLNYASAQAIVLFIPILIFSIKDKLMMVFNRRMLLLILILLLITVIRAQVFANILVATVIAIFSFFGSKRLPVSVSLMIIISAIIIFVPISFYAEMFRGLGSYFPVETNIHYKLNDFATFIELKELETTTGAGGRAERYPILIKAFITNPILGFASSFSNIDITGGFHLFFMNRLTIWGLPAFLFYLYTLYVIIKFVYQILPKDYRFFYLLTWLAYAFLGLTKVIGGRETIVMLIIIIPGLFLSIQSKRDIVR